MFQQLLKNYRKALIRPPSLTPLECNQKIAQALQRKEPCFVGRMGWLEGFVLGSLLAEGKISDTLREKLASNAGIFSSLSEEKEIHLFSKAYLSALFGVSGTRWQKLPHFQSIITPAWRRPLEEERPVGWENLENGCYC